MIDPRLEIMEMLHEMKQTMQQIEDKLAEIPREDEDTSEYDAHYVAPVEGDYMHPHTATHPCPEGFGSGAYWDHCLQCWMMPNRCEDDSLNLSTNMDPDMTWSEDEEDWVEQDEDDWSNEYETMWKEMDTEEMSENPAPVDTAPYEHRMPVAHAEGVANETQLELDVEVDEEEDTEEQ